MKKTNKSSGYFIGNLQESSYLYGNVTPDKKKGAAGKRLPGDPVVEKLVDGIMDKALREKLSEVQAESLHKRKKFGPSDLVIVKLVNGIVVKAIHRQSPEIHFLPDKDTTKVCFRRDGVTDKFIDLPLAAGEAVRDRFKILGGLDIIEQRVPQDGRISFRLRTGETQRTYTYTIFSRPQLHGEDIILAIEKMNC